MSKTLLGQFCMPDEARDGRNVALIDKCFMVCSIVQRRIKLLHIILCVYTVVVVRPLCNVFEEKKATRSIV